MSYLAFALIKVYSIALFIILFMGASAGILFGMINSLVQLEVPRHLRARVMGIYSFVLFGSMPLGSLLLSLLLNYFSAPYIVIIFSLLSYIGSIFVLLTQKNFLHHSAIKV